MASTDWRIVKPLLEEALELPPEERAAFVARSAGGDADLRRELEDYLALEENAGDFIEEPAARLSSRSGGGLVGQRLGSWVVESEVGRGGMGAVYTAIRADEAFEKRVAVKVLKRGMDTDEIVSRFHHERRILAQLDHPSIAKLLDAGTTGDGRPYFVMEEVEGRPIDEYCDARRLGIEARLRLFRTVCEAVSFAHRNLVVHRDIKPGNILVTEEGEAKLLDFGIAKLLGEAGSGEHEVSLAGVRVLTPEYASPEQIAGGVITTASDVYSLGVLLYVLLTGHRPYRFTKRSVTEVARVIAEEEPDRPSTKVKRVEELTHSDGTKSWLTPEEVSAPRALEPLRLHRRLAGDLDHIVLKALRKEPDHRYQTVEQFSDDVERHLENLPVLARRGSTAYRAGRFLRRHWRETVVAAVFVLLIAGFGLREAQRSAQLRAALDTTADMAEVLAETFTQADPERAREGGPSPLELLDSASVQLQEATQLPPELRAQLLDNIGRTYRTFGAYDEAKRSLKPSLDLRKQVFGDQHPAVASSLQNLAAVLQELDQLEEAEELMREALSIREILHAGSDHEELVIARNNLAEILRQQREHAEAEALVSEALAMARRLGEEGVAQAATSLSILGSIRFGQQDFEAAEKIQREVLEIRQNLPDASNLSIARAMNNLGVTLTFEQKYTQAEEFFRRSLELRIEELGEENQQTGTAFANLGTVLYRQGRYAESEPELLKGYQIRARNSSSSDDDVQDLKRLAGRLADLYNEWGKPEKAAEYRALAEP